MESSKCIFCTAPADGRRREHVMPECFGANPHVLPPGIVCDRCNEYFGVKIEKPLAEDPYFLSQRTADRVWGKNGTIPPTPMIHLESGVVCHALAEPDGSSSIMARSERDERRFIPNLAIA